MSKSLLSYSRVKDIHCPNTNADLQQQEKDKQTVKSVRFSEDVIAYYFEPPVDAIPPVSTTTPEDVESPELLVRGVIR
jgi:hypothetical protein